jgi:hypothetical protein
MYVVSILGGGAPIGDDERQMYVVSILGGGAPIGDDEQQCM